MHVDQTGYRKLSGELEHLRATRDVRAIGTIDRYNASIANHDRHVRSNDRLSEIDDRDVVDYDCRPTSGALSMKQEWQADTQQ